MPTGRKSGPESRQAALDRLLEESRELQRRSEELAAEVARLREQVAKDKEPAAPDRRKKPRMKGK